MKQNFNFDDEWKETWSEMKRCGFLLSSAAFITVGLELVTELLQDAALSLNMAAVSLTDKVTDKIANKLDNND